MIKQISKTKAIELLKLGWFLRHDVPYNKNYELYGAGTERYWLSKKSGDELMANSNLVEIYHQSGIHIYQWEKETE
jgi:hypothetical protein